MHKVFISYHHGNDQQYKEALLEMNRGHQIFIDRSVNTGDISEELSDESIRAKIRDEYLRDSTVTILLVGQETKYRKHIDWEIYSSMIDGTVNRKSGVLVVSLPTIYCDSFYAGHVGEAAVVYPEYTGAWRHDITRAEFEEMYPYLPDRIIDNLLVGNANISVVPWNKIFNQPEKLRFLVDATYSDRSHAEYDLSRRMRRQNS